MIEPIFYVFDLFLCHMFKAAAFGDVLSDKTVDIFIKSPFPGNPPEKPIFPKVENSHIL